MSENLLYPGICVEEEPSTTHPIGGVPTSIAAFVGCTDRGPSNEPVRVLGSADYQRIFGPLDPSSDMSYALADFFRNGGSEAWVVSVGASCGSSSPDDLIGSDEQKTGIYSLDTVDLFNILLIPNQSDPTIHRAMIAFAERRRAFALLDLPPEARTATDAAAWISGSSEQKPSNAAAYFPRLLAADEAQGGLVRSFANSGAIAGIFARTDREQGVWPAPAGTAAQIEGVVGLESELSEAEQEELNAAGLNSLRSFPSAGMLVWGSRTLAGADASASDWKYIPVRRTALFIEESLYQGLQWAVFEPNGEPTWAKIRLCVEGLLQSLFGEGAFQGSTPGDAYFVRCDAGTTTRADIEAGRLNVEIGFAPLTPAEFVLLRIALPNLC